MRCRHPIAFLLSTLLFAGACGPEISGPVTVGVLGPGDSPGSYAIVPTSLPEVESLRSLSGPGVEVLAGAKIIIDQEEIATGIETGEIRTLDDIRDTVLRRKGKTPRAMFSAGTLQTSEGEVEAWLAEDFDSLGMVTAYAHVAQARRDALEAGMPASCLARLPLYYDLSFAERVGGSGDKQHDNAFFMPLMGSIFFLPYDAFPTLSMAMNQGIIAHEYSHGIWACLVEDFEPFPWRSLSLDGPSQARLAGFNEGVADYFAAGVTRDSNFLAVSLPVVSAERDTSVVRLYSQAMAEDAIDGGGYDPYPLGAVLASALWRIREETGDDALSDRWVMEALAALPDTLDLIIASGSGLEVDDFLAVFVTTAGAEGTVFQGRVCRFLQERFALAGPLRGCP